MKWLAVIGTREATGEMQRDVMARVGQAVDDGWGIVTGGSTGVDTIAIIAAMQHGGMVRVYLPTTIDRYVQSLRERATQGRCLPVDAEATIAVLHDLGEVDPRAIMQPEEDVLLTPEAFYARNELVLQLADAVVAYHLSGNATASKLPGRDTPHCRARS